MKRIVSWRGLLCMIGSVVLILCMLLQTTTTQATTHRPSGGGGIKAKLTHIVPLYNKAVQTNIRALPCLNSVTVPLCYSPQQMRTAYGIEPLLQRGVTGKGSTIVIIDNYQSPTLRSDLQLFDKIFGLPDPQLNVFTPFGLKPFDPQDPAASDFAAEISLDVQWSHAIAPEATINLVLGNPRDSSLRAQLDALVAATTYAVNANLGNVISLSVGAGETCINNTDLQAWHQDFINAQKKNIAVFVSSGDSGALALTCDAAGNVISFGQGVNYPASDPLVTAVGGTSLLLTTPSGKYVGETTWNNIIGATGGGMSALFARPTYQINIPGIGSTRGVPDVAYNADPNTGVPIVIGLPQLGGAVILPAGGTSAGAPQWAAITVLMEQQAGRRFASLNKAFYNILRSPSYTLAFHDITIGNNSVMLPLNSQQQTIPGFNAGPGWDAVTGVGSPNVAELAPLMTKYDDASIG